MVTREEQELDSLFFYCIHCTALFHGHLHLGYLQNAFFNVNIWQERKGSIWGDFSLEKYLSCHNIFTTYVPELFLENDKVKDKRSYLVAGKKKMKKARLDGKKPRWEVWIVFRLNWGRNNEAEKMIPKEGYERSAENKDSLATLFQGYWLDIRQ